jgi:hypothetical protein
MGLWKKICKACFYKNVNRSSGFICVMHMYSIICTILFLCLSISTYLLISYRAAGYLQRVFTKHNCSASIILEPLNYLVLFHMVNNSSILIHIKWAYLISIIFF